MCCAGYIYLIGLKCSLVIVYSFYSLDNLLNHLDLPFEWHFSIKVSAGAIFLIVARFH